MVLKAGFLKNKDKRKKVPKRTDRHGGLSSSAFEVSVDSMAHMGIYSYAQ